jgi:hypothetical protein
MKDLQKSLQVIIPHLTLIVKWYNDGGGCVSKEELQAFNEALESIEEYIKERE